MPQQIAAMLPLAALVWLLPFCITASQNATCGDIYYPPSLRPSSDRFSVVTAGLTGTGKSTLVDMLTGGHEMSVVGTPNGDSETEQACDYHFEFMGGESPSDGHERWEALDTPGFDDTGGRFQMMSNNAVVEKALRNMGKVDAILLVWKYDEKFTVNNLNAFLQLRSMFDASIWKRVILVYTWWRWEDCVEFLCECKTQSDLAKVHKDTMTAAFNHISRLAGDPRCNRTVPGNCFPEAQDIPFIGSDLTVSKLRRMRDLGCDPLHPDSMQGSCTSTCPVDAAQSIRSMRSILDEMTKADGYQKMDTSGLVNYWASCEKASSNLQLMIDNCTDTSRCPDILANDTAAQLQQCLRGGIASETSKVAALLQGRLELQANVAFFMTRREYIAAPFFSAATAELIDEYPDYLTYKTCKIATDLNNQDAAVLTDAVTACWTRLASAEGIARSPKFNVSINGLLSSYKSRSFSLRMSVALNMMHCHTDDESCPGAIFVRSVSTAEEMQDLTSLRGVSSEGRCCDHQGQTWSPRSGVCNNNNAVWNQTSIDCLRHCSLDDLKLPNCSIKSGEVWCKLQDAFGQTADVKGAFLQHPTGKVPAYIHTGGAITLHFNLSNQVSFVMSHTESQRAECHEGAWQTPATWVLPKARQVRSCRVCYKVLECLSDSCISGLGLKNKLWLTGDSVDSEVCSDAQICGPQRDSNCAERPTCVHQSGAFFKTRDCSNHSCHFGACCEKLGTCEGVCGCPWKPRKSQPTHCKGPHCLKHECCEKDPTIDSCSKATGGTCAFRKCFDWRGDTKCVRRGLFQHECVCARQDECARNYGYQTGKCMPKCTNPRDCGPDTGGYCDKTMSHLGVNTCRGWRGDTRCVHGRCLCKKPDSCAVDYGENWGHCNDSTVFASTAAENLAEVSAGVRPELVTAIVGAFWGGLLAAVSAMLVKRRQRALQISEFRDPLLRGEVFEDQ